jgi:peptide-methionine (S)-S-oxide reductase
MNHRESACAETIVLGGGCFWCTEAVFKEVRGVLDVESGYSNGQASAPSYELVCTGRTGCAEVVKLVYDPAQVSTRQLLEIFFAVHDQTQLNRQGNDMGTQYRSGIYFTMPGQREVANDLIREMRQDVLYDAPVVTEVEPLRDYFAAEDYHQDFFEKNPYQGYCLAVAEPKVAKFRKTFQALAKG